jgi:ParB-like chromosome segregation protein Spo0J
VKFHPYSEVFPLIEGAEFDALVADIKANGLREKIWLYEGKILDGRNRFLACKKAGVKPLTRKYTGKDALAFVVSANIARRHLTVEQRSLAGARIATLQRGDNQHTARAASSQKEVAEKLGVSTDSIQRAKKVIEHGSKALQNAVESGDVPLKKAASVVGLPKSEQLKAATQPPDPILSDDWTPEVPGAEEMEAIEREIEDSEAKVLRADDVTIGYHNELKRQAAEIAVLKTTRDGYMNGKAAVTRMLEAEQRKVAKLQKEIAKLREENEALRERISIMEAA